MVGRRSRTWSQLLLVAAAFGAVAVACATTDTIDQGYQELSGGAGGAGGEGQGGAATSSSSKASSSSSASGHASSSSSGPASSSASSGAGGAPCTDDGPGEPNDTEAQAHQLPAIDDCDGSGSKLDATLADAADVDWYKYKGDDTFGCVVDPTRDVSAMGTFRFCKFIQCDGGNPSLTCPSGTTPDVSPEGLPGCCGGDGFTLDLDCPGSDDNAWVYMRLDQPNPVCSAYTLNWHY